MGTWPNLEHFPENRLVKEKKQISKCLKWINRKRIDKEGKHVIETAASLLIVSHHVSAASENIH